MLLVQAPGHDFMLLQSSGPDVRGSTSTRCNSTTSSDFHGFTRLIGAQTGQRERLEQRVRWNSAGHRAMAFSFHGKNSRDAAWARMTSDSNRDNDSWRGINTQGSIIK